jgi:hypothetical protein
VLVAHYLPMLCAHIVTARLVEEKTWRHEARGKKKAGGGGGGEGETMPLQMINKSAAVQQKR